MSRRFHALSLILAVAVLAAPVAVRAEDPDPSIIENQSGRTYQIRISDDLAPAGVVKFYVLDEQGSKTQEATRQSLNDSYPLPPNAKVYMTICGSPKFKDALVALYLSLDQMTADGRKVDKKSQSRLHFTHLQIGTKLIAPSAVKDVAKSIGLDLSKVPGGDPVTVNKGDKNIDVFMDKYQKGLSGDTFWVVSK